MSVNTPPAAPLADIALRVWRSRAAPAQAMVRNGRWTKEEADARLRPWGAIALLCEAPIFTSHVEERRRPIVFYKGDGSRGDYNHRFPEAEARSDVARDLSERAEWEPVLSHATHAAMDAHAAARTDQTEQAARDLLCLCRELGVIPRPAPAAAAERLAA